MKFSSVVSLHTNPLTCGVAKFSAELAQRLGVPFLGLNEMIPGGSKHPLFSLKWSEFDQESITGFCSRLSVVNAFSYSLFWHDKGDPRVVGNVSDRAAHVFYADPSLGSPGLFCPSLIEPKPRTLRLFTFGMAGRLQIEPWKKVAALLEQSGNNFHLRVSVGIHEGTALDRVEDHFDKLLNLLGPERVTIVGIMTDDAVAEELASADYVLAFFEHGARANNTTIHAAIEAGCGVITNWDSKTPLFFNQATKSIDHLTSWPARPGVQRSPYTWDELLRRMRELCDNSR